LLPGSYVGKCHQQGMRTVTKKGTCQYRFCQTGSDNVGYCVLNVKQLLKCVACCALHWFISCSLATLYLDVNSSNGDSNANKEDLMYYAVDSKDVTLWEPLRLQAAIVSEKCIASNQYCRCDTANANEQQQSKQCTK
jgi:hypothetical protein